MSITNSDQSATDHVLYRLDAMGAGAEPVLGRKPAVLVTVRGGNYRSGTPHEGWDHATAWMRRILADVWKLDLKIVEAEFALVGVNPAMDQFKDLARELRDEAEDQARRTGRQLGAALAIDAHFHAGTPRYSFRSDQQAA